MYGDINAALEIFSYSFVNGFIEFMKFGLIVWGVWLSFALFRGLVR